MDVDSDSDAAAGRSFASPEPNPSSSWSAGAGGGGSLRERDLGKWLERKLGRADDVWSAQGSTGLLSKDLLESIPGVFLDLSHQAKLRLLLAVFHLPQRSLEAWRDEVEAVVSLASRDTDDWVTTIAQLLAEITVTGNLALTAFAEASASASPTGLEGQLTKTVSDLAAVFASEAAELRLLPQSAALLCGEALEDAFGEPPRSRRHFQPTRRPKSAATRADLLAKAKDAASSAKGHKGSSMSSVVPIRSRTGARKMDNNTPLRGIPSANPLKATGGFRDTNFARPVASSVAGREKAGGAKLINIEETPQALKKRRREQEAEAKEQRKRDKEEAKIRAAKEKEQAKAEALAKEKERRAAAERERAERLAKPAPEKPQPVPVSSAPTPTPAGGPKAAAIPTYAAAAMASAGLPTQPQPSQPLRPPQASAAPLTRPAYPSYAPQPAGSLPSSLPSQAPGQPPRPAYAYVPGAAPATPSYVPQPQPSYLPQQAPSVPSSLPSSSAGPSTSLGGPGGQGSGPGQPPTVIAPPAAPSQRKYTISKEVMQEAQDMFRSANMLSRPEKALILGFMAGNMENPCPQMGDILTVRLSEHRQPLPLEDGRMGERLTETFFQMNYASGEWKRLQKVRHLVPQAPGQPPPQQQPPMAH